MPFHPAPTLPRALAELLPYGRRAYELERGADAGLELHFLDEGDAAAPAVVLLHGNPTWSFLWRNVIAELPRLRCIAPDLIGFGLSGRFRRAQDHSLDRHADIVAELLTALDLRRFVLVGHDMGGPIATGVGARLPDRVAGLVLTNTLVVVPRTFHRAWYQRIARTPVVGDVVFRLGFPQNVLWTVQHDRRSIRGRVAAAYRYPFRRVADRTGPLALVRLVPDALEHPSIPALERGEAWARGFEGPAALVWGTRDPVLGRALAMHERAFPAAPVTLGEAGHFLQEEIPQAIAAAIEDVVRRAGLATG